MIKFSVITIVRNDITGIMRTMKSVFAQTYKNFEIIVQDGASTDGTSEVLRGFGNWIDCLTIEQDNGIYDAMNRALRQATGDYCIFMNASDFFVNSNVLEQVSKLIDPGSDDIWAGQAINDELGVIHRYRQPEDYWAGSTIDHQAAFIRTSLLQELEHDTRFSICGDLHFFTRARKNNARFRHAEFVVARKPFAVGASSDFTDRLRDRLGMLEEAWGDTHPVRDILERELKVNTSRAFDLDPTFIAQMPLEDLLSERDRWSKLL